MSVKAVSRGAGRSATAASAYRAGEKVVDYRTGVIHDYTRRHGVEHAQIVLPTGAPEWAAQREKLWNAAEEAEKRKDACVAREYEVALPAELSPAERQRLAVDFARELADKEGCAVDVCLHEPDKEGDQRNYHAHIMRTTRKVGPDGLTDKLDTEKAGRNRKADLEAVRARWAELTNERLAENGFSARVDHRTLEAQGIEREPETHRGPVLTEMLRKGRPSEVLERQAEANERLQAAYDEARECRAERAERVIELDTNLRAALDVRSSLNQGIDRGNFYQHAPAKPRAARPGPLSDNRVRALSERHLAGAGEHEAGRLARPGAGLLQAADVDHRHESGGLRRPELTGAQLQAQIWLAEDQAQRAALQIEGLQDVKATLAEARPAWQELVLEFKADTRQRELQARMEAERQAQELARKQAAEKELADKALYEKRLASLTPPMRAKWDAHLVEKGMEPGSPAARVELGDQLAAMEQRKQQAARLEAERRAEQERQHRPKGPSYSGPSLG